MQISDKKLAANRANAQKSHGPVTEQGKRISSRNSTRHILLADSILVDLESKQNFKTLYNSLLAHFDPQDAEELLHVETIAAARWRLSRLWTVQAESINHEIRRQASSRPDEDRATRVMFAMRSLAESGKSQNAFSLYEHRFDRQQHRAIEALERLRQEKERLKEKKIAGAKRSHQVKQNKQSAPIIDPTKPAIDPKKEPIDPTPEAINPTE